MTVTFYTFYYFHSFFYISCIVLLCVAAYLGQDPLTGDFYLSVAFLVKSS